MNTTDNKSNLGNLDNPSNSGVKRFVDKINLEPNNKTEVYKSSQIAVVKSNSVFNEFMSVIVMNNDSIQETRVYDAETAKILAEAYKSLADLMESDNIKITQQ